MPQTKLTLDDFENTADGYLKQTQAAIRTNLATADPKVSADALAQQHQIGQRLGLPPAVVAARESDMRLEDTAATIAANTAGAPVARKFYSGNKDWATMAADDSFQLRDIERAVKAIFSPTAEQQRNNRAWIGSTAGAIASGIPSIGQGLFGGAAFLAGSVSPGGDVESAMLDFAQRSKETATAWQGKYATSDNADVRAIGSGLSSGGQNLALLPFGLLRGAGTLLGLMAGITGGQTYAQDRQFDPLANKPRPTVNRAGFHAMADATAEYVGEKYLGMGGFLERVAAGASAGKLAAYELFKEVPGEIGTTLWQNFNEWALINPEKPVREFLQEQPRAIRDTIIATVVGGGTQIAGVKAIEAALPREQRRQMRSDAANLNAQALEHAQTLAAATKLAERSPSALREYLQEVVQDTPYVYVDSAALVEAGVDLQQLAQVVPSVADQLYQPEIGGDLKIPTAELLVNTIDSGLEKTLFDHVRTGEDHMSRAEAEAFVKDQGERIKGEIDKVLAARVDDATFKAGRNAIFEDLFNKLREVGRHTDDVNRRLASMHADVYTVLAARAGLTPEQMMAEYALDITGERGRASYDKKTRLGEISVEAYHYGNNALTHTSGAAYGTGLKGSDREDILNATDKRLRKRTYFYVDKGTGINPEAGVGGIAHRAQLTNIYDANSDPLRLRSGNKRAFETAVLDAGFAGYLDRLDGTQSGHVVLLGDHMTPVESLGPMGKTTGKVVPPPAARPSMGRDVVVDAINARKDLPAGALSLQRWQELLPEHARALGVIWDDGPFYKSELIKAFQDATEAPTYEQATIEERERALAYQARAQQLVANMKVPARSAVGFMNGTRKLPGRLRTNFEIGKFFARINKGGNLDSGASRRAVVDALYADSLYALSKSSDAVGWYNHKVRTALEEVAALHPEITTSQEHRTLFLLILAITSNSTAVNENFENAHATYTHFKNTGVWPRAMMALDKEADGTIKRGPDGQPLLRESDSKVAGSINPALADVEALLLKHGWQATRDFLLTEHSVAEIEAFTGRKLESELATARVHGALFFGSKVGTFFNNLHGNYNALTMDRWFMRSTARVQGNMLQLSDSLGKQLDKLDEQLQRDIDTFGVDRAMIRGEIDAFRALDATAKLDVEVVNRVLPLTLKYVAARHAAFAKQVKGEDGRMHGYLDRTSENVLAKTIHENLTLDRQAPSGGTERQQLRDIMRAVQARMHENGIPIEMADLQAVLWYYEKDLFDFLKQGSQESLFDDSEGRNEDYETAAKRLRRILDGDGSGGAGPGRPAKRAPAKRSGPAPADTTGDLFQSAPVSRAPGPLDGAPSVPGYHGPDPAIVSVVEQYARDNGIPLRRQAVYVHENPGLGRRIAAAYAEMKHDPNDPQVREAYQNMLAQTRAQYDALVAAGYSFTFFDSKTDPYDGNPWNAMRDLRATKTMAVYGTYDGYGTEGITQGATENNPLLVDTGLRWPDQAGVLHPVTGNDLFRAVHDAFGHGLEGAGFRARGEENAWQAHRRLFTGSAVGAMTSETRGQNSWLNYGPHAEANKTAKVYDTVFADQKIGLMPEWTWNEGVAPDEGDELNQSAFHGTPHRGITQFSTDKIGTGEGAQAYGWGLYFASRREVGEFYRKKLSLNRGDLTIVDRWSGDPIPSDTPGFDLIDDSFKTYGGDFRPEDRARYKQIWTDRLEQIEGERAAEIDALETKYREAGDTASAAAAADIRKSDAAYAEKLKGAIALVDRVEAKAGGQLYEVDIPEDSEMLDWDKPLGEQPEGVLRSLVDAANSQEDGSRFARAVQDGGNRGIDLYRALLADMKDTGLRKSEAERAASEYLAEFGIKGIRYMGDSSTNYVVFSGDDVAIQNQLYQAGQGPRGSISFGFGQSTSQARQSSLMRLLDNADLSTFLHESGHLYLEIAMDLASKIEGRIAEGVEVSPGERSLVEDMQKTLAWFGLKSEEGMSGIDSWLAMSIDQKRQFHEQWARGFEAYLFEGKSPNARLRDAFRTFRSWLVQVYRNLVSSADPSAADIGRALNVKLSDEVRGVMDRLVATPAEIAEAEASAEMGPLFRTPEEAGMTPEEWHAYHTLGVAATVSAQEALSARSLQDMQWLSRAKARKLKELQAQHDDLRKATTNEVRAIVMSEPVYRAWAFLTGTQDQVLPGTVAPEDIDPNASGKLRTQFVKEIDPAAWLTLSTRHMTSDVTGIDPEIIAQVFGFDSGRALVHALAEAEDPAEVIRGTVDRLMLERHGDLATPADIERAANEAIHDEARARFVAAELTALEKAGEVRETKGKTKRGHRITADVLAKAAKDYAREIIGRLRVGDVKPKQFMAAATRSGAQALKVRKDLAKAALHKRNQLINTAAANEATKALSDVEQALAYFKRVEKSTSIPADYLARIHALLEKFDLRTSVSQKELDNRASFRTWAKGQLDQGNLPPNFELLLTPAQLKAYTREISQRDEDGNLIHPDEEDQALVLAGFLDEAPVRNVRDMTIDEIRGLRDAIKQIEHMGRRTKKVLTDRKNREFKALVTEMRERIEEVAERTGRKANDTRTPNDTTGSRKLSWRGFFFSHIKAANLLRIMDGGDGGPLTEHLVLTANRAGEAETVDMAKSHDVVQALLKPVVAEGPLTGREQFFPTINRSLNKQAVLVMAMNLGNASNEQRLLGGEGWTREQIEPVLATLTEADWRFVQGMWDHFESFRPRVGAMELEVSGREPEWIDARPLQVQTSDGKTLSLRGGYAPVIFDPRASGIAASQAAAKDAKAMLQAARVANTVTKGFTKARVTEVHGRPLMLSLDAMIGGIQDTIHYLNWQPWIIDANRMLRALDAPMRQYYGATQVQQLRDWATDNAAGVRPARDGAERAVTRVARNISYAGLAFNVMSAASQVTGYSQSVVTIGAKWMARGVARSLANPLTARADAAAKSTFMLKRTTHLMRDLAEVNNTVQGQTATRAWMEKWGYGLMASMQSAVDVPTWWGAYEKAIDAGQDEEGAVALADQAVRDAQGSGLQSDLSSVERQQGAIRLLTGFMSFMNTTLNLNYRVLKSEESAPAKALDLIMVNVVPVALMMVLKAALTPGDSGDDDPEALTKKFGAEMLNFLFGQLIGFREIAPLGSALMGDPLGVYNGSSGLRWAADILKFARQVGQGELDLALLKAAINVLGNFFRIPSAQINRGLTGTDAMLDDKTENPGALLTGFQEPR